MTLEPRFALRTERLADAVTLYVDAVGFTLLERGEDRALLRTLGGAAFLLLSPTADAADVRVLDARPTWLHPDAAALAARLPGELRELPTGDRSLRARGPDGEVLVFLERAELPPDRWFEHYRRGADELDEALAGLAENDIDLSRGAAEWTIRHHVHHLADAEGLFFQRMQTALGEPGAAFRGTWPGANQATAENMKYARRPIEPSLALFRALRAHFVQLIEYVPGVFDRSVVDDDAGTVRFVDDLAVVARHLYEHTAEIGEIRRLHGR